MQESLVDEQKEVAPNSWGEDTRARQRGYNHAFSARHPHYARDYQREKYGAVPRPLRMSNEERRLRDRDRMRKRYAVINAAKDKVLTMTNLRKTINSILDYKELWWRKWDKRLLMAIKASEGWAWVSHRMKEMHGGHSVIKARRRAKRKVRPRNRGKRSESVTGNYGHLVEMVCFTCGMVKPFNDFNKTAHTCKDCLNKKKREKYKATPPGERKHGWGGYSKEKTRICKREREAAKRSGLRGGDAVLRSIYSDAVRAPRVKCFYCRKIVHVKDRHVDHVMPLALKGRHSSGNAVIACSKCNLSKGAKHPNEVGLLC